MVGSGLMRAQNIALLKSMAPVGDNKQNIELADK